MGSQKFDAIDSWLDARWSKHGFRVVRRQAGTYGLVWILETDRPHITPRRTALKGADPARGGSHGDLQGIFEREARLWLALPYHMNVLPALGIEIVPGTAGGKPWPLVRMPAADASLEAWLGPEHGDRTEKLAWLAQLCNGLSWLYRNGLHGHGDLKPANVLVQALAAPGSPFEGQSLPRGLRHRILIADLGWADIWREVEGPEAVMRGWRPYLGPERIGGEFVPRASDMFAVGVIAVEIVSGLHPAGHPTSTVGKWKSTRYERWAREGQRCIPEMPAGCEDIVRGCLDPRPENRPGPEEVMERISRSLTAELGLDLTATLRAWSQVATDGDTLPQGRQAEDAGALSPARALRMAVDMFEFGEQMMRQRLRAEPGGASDDEVERRLRAWLRHRPGAEHGDGEGRPVPWPR